MFLAYLQGIETGNGASRGRLGLQFLAYLQGIETFLKTSKSFSSK